jgi:hypothetical protein
MQNFGDSISFLDIKWVVTLFVVLKAGINVYSDSNCMVENKIWQISSFEMVRKYFHNFEGDSPHLAGTLENIKYDYTNNKIHQWLTNKDDSIIAVKDTQEFLAKYQVYFQKNKYYVWESGIKEVFIGDYSINENKINLLQKGKAYVIHPTFTCLLPDTLKLTLTIKSEGSEQKYLIVYCRLDICNINSSIREIDKYRKRQQCYFLQPDIFRIR